MRNNVSHCRAVTTSPAAPGLIAKRYFHLAYCKAKAGRLEAGIAGKKRGRSREECQLTLVRSYPRDDKRRGEVSEEVTAHADTLSCERRSSVARIAQRTYLALYCIPRKHLNDDPGSKETALVDKSPARKLDFSRPITPPPPELTRERACLKERHSAQCGAGGGTVLSLPDHQADLVPNYKSH
ncbi:hypothetical protein ALC56_10612 [Trachymyrmex septentrionalis]|uniref:Uncharacterized protein n=1 Tax=Trachymyrmex septentrionalis TaxID=34720 RepID=A0A195F361_9HYME|nr:hypothetical protein ALC56_10612 [Trachymyrmex septentrionalis]